MKRRKKATKNNILVNMIKNLFTICLAMMLAFYVGLKFYIASLPPIENLESFSPNIVTKIYSQDGEIIKTFTAYKFEHISIEKVPKHLIEAIIATEDKNFYSHSGYDIFGLIRSTFANIKAGSFVQGASTITQQLARILFLSNEKTFDRKIKEFIVSAQIEKTLSKDQILEMYLNNVYLGSGAYGVEGASQIYFNKSVKDLNIAQCALIAGLPQAPSIYSPFNNPELAKKRQKHVLKRMLKMDYITKEEYEIAVNSNLMLNPNPHIYSYNKAPYFIDLVMDELNTLGFDERDVSSGGYKITTTLNYKAQKAADEAIRKYLRVYGLTKDKQQSACYGISPLTGEILVYVGGKNYEKSQYDRIQNAIRPPGSSFKPFVYAAALQKGWGINDKLSDSPVTIGDWSPRNYGSKYRGNMPLYKGLTYSSNVMAAKLIKDTGVRPVISIVRSLGISTPIENDMTIALGSNGVKLSEMVVAYGAFANGGYKVKPFSVLSVETSRGKILYEAPKARIVKAISTETASGITQMLKTVITHGTGRAANINKPAAGKSGTTDNYKDAWFIGYTPDVVLGVWVGNDDNTKMGIPLTGGTVPALIWKDTMKVATQSYGSVDFSYEPIEIIKEKPQIDNNYIPSEIMEEEEESQEAQNQTQEANSNSHALTTDETLNETNNNHHPSQALSKPKMQENKTTQEKENASSPQINQTTTQKETTTIPDNINLPEPKPSNGD